MKSQSMTVAFSAVTLVVLTMSAACAQQGIAKACAADVKAQCAGVQPGEGRIRACIMEHFKDLSEPCRFVVLKDFGTDVGSDEFNDRRRLGGGERTQEQRFHRRLILQRRWIRLTIIGQTRTRQHAADRPILH